MTLAENKKRARSEEEKEARRTAILDAARGMIAESGFDAVTMSGLAKRAGLAKGTLYLYVRTKEELFLALFLDAIDALVARLEAEATADNLADLIGRLPTEVPLFLPLLARLVAVIESNVADESLFAAKRQMEGYGARLTALIARLTGASPERAGAATSALMLAMQGAAQFDLTARRAPDTLPDDLIPVFASHAFAMRFPPAAWLILATLD